MQAEDRRRHQAGLGGSILTEANLDATVMEWPL